MKATRLVVDISVCKIPVLICMRRWDLSDLAPALSRYETMARAGKQERYPDLVKVRRERRAGEMKYYRTYPLGEIACVRS